MSYLTLLKLPLSERQLLEDSIKPLPADVFDTLEIMALAVGGVGHHADYIWGTPTIPYCIHGLAKASETYPGQPDSKYIENILYSYGISREYNDRVVSQILEKKSLDKKRHRISFKEWCEGTKVVRGT
jgi:hypothetical protein